MSSVKLNVLANLSGNIWVSLIGLVFIPVYIKLMGVEAYGLVGVFVSLQAIFSVLDLGLSQSLSREMARLSIAPGQATLMRDTARTMEVLYACGALTVALVIYIASDYIAYKWLNPDKLSAESVKYSICLIALVVGMRWPLALYIGGLNGLQRQVLLNFFTCTFATLQSIGALIVLLWVECTIEAFFVWQVIVAALQVFVVRYYFWSSLPGQGGAFSLKILHEIWRFALGMTGISLLAILLTQLDKLLLSRLLSLQDFGFYVFASAAAAIIFKLSAPLFNAFLPRFTQFVALADESSLGAVYRTSCQLMALVIIPASCILFFFSDNVLLLWTRDQNLVDHTALLFALLVVGNAVNGLMTLPYALQLANAWTRLALYQNVVAVLVFIPAIYFSSSRWGGVGAAICWIILNSLYLVIGVHLMHTRLLVSEKWYWYTFGVFVPLLVGAGLTALTAKLQVDGSGIVVQLISIFIASSVVFVTVALSLPVIRGKMLSAFSKYFYSKGTSL